VSAVSYHLEGDIAVLGIDNPPVNALALPVREALQQALARAGADAAVRGIVLTGTHDSFSAGADINEIGSGLALQAPTLRDLQTQLEASSKPIVAAIRGTAFGGGFELALTCHYRVASAAARLGLPEVKIGLLPGAGGTLRVTRLAGPAAALEIITSGNPISASRALELQLIDEVAPDPVGAAAALARKVATAGVPLRIASEVSARITGRTMRLMRRE